MAFTYRLNLFGFDDRWEYLSSLTLNNNCESLKCMPYRKTGLDQGIFEEIEERKWDWDCGQKRYARWR